MKFTRTVLKISEPEKRVPYQFIATFTGSIAILCTGMTFGWATPSLPKLLAVDSPIPITQSDGSWLAVMPCIGSAVGCLLTAKIVDTIGRKYCMLLASPLYFLSWIITAYSKSVLAFYLGRFLSGNADGIAFTAFPMYLGEIADSKIRGFLCASIPITTVLGFLLISVIGSYFSIQTTALISALFPIAHFGLFYFMPESPYYLLMKGKAEKAKEMLIKLRGYDAVEDELQRLEYAVVEDNENKGSMWDLFTVKSNRKGIYIVIGLRGLQQFCGTMAITFYATIIFHESGSSLSSSSCTSIYFSIQLICSMICSVLVDRIGRRPLLMVSVIGACFALAVEGTYFYLRDHTAVNLHGLTLIPVIALLCYNVVFNLGMGTIPAMMLGELFPTNVKAFALCLADIYYGLVVIIVSKFFQITKDMFGMHVPFMAFSIFNMVGLFYIIFCIPETKGKTLEEIQDYFKGKLPDKSKVESIT